MTRYRDAAVTLWGDAGAYAHDAYSRLRGQLYPELPETLPIVIGITAYGHCHGLTRGTWRYGPRISLASWAFTRGGRHVDDLLTHEMLHASLMLARLQSEHDSADWYSAVRRLSPAVLGRDLDAGYVTPGVRRKSVRVPNPDWSEGSDKPKTLVRKTPASQPVEHKLVARWPHAFRPDSYYAREVPIPCPAY